MNTKTILITGSTDGIGKNTAIKLAKEGHKVYIHGRNNAKLDIVLNEIKEISGNKNIQGIVCDLSDLGSIKDFTNEFKQREDSLDVLINNAGVLKTDKIINENGLDVRFVVNYLAPYILTSELIELIDKSRGGRIINLSSAAQSSIDYEVMLGEKQTTDIGAYAQSKLALTMWSIYLANQVNNVEVIALNPGSLLNTKMVEEAFGQYSSEIDKGVNIIYDLAVSDKYCGINGKYFDNDIGDFNKAHVDCYNDGKISDLINNSNKILAKINIKIN